CAVIGGLPHRPTDGPNVDCVGVDDDLGDGLATRLAHVGPCDTCVVGAQKPVATRPYHATGRSNDLEISARPAQFGGVLAIEATYTVGDKRADDVVSTEALSRWSSDAS